MGESQANRSRPIRKALSFTEDEWKRVERRMVLAEHRAFEPFGRAAVLDGEVRVQRVAFDPSVLRAELSKIGNNINQIARHVNTDDAVTLSEMRTTRLLLSQIQQQITAAIDGAESEN